jgi:radical SAM protein with 4Fe4S-binding SPASM domain
MRTGPDYIQFYPTLRCNLSCDFCFNRSLSRMQDMTLDDFIVMLDVLKRTLVKTIDIIGGEPTLHPDMVSFIEQAVSQGLSVNLSSNGTNLPMLETISQLRGNINVGISINDRETLERVRGFVQEHKPVVKSIYGTALDPSLVREILLLGPKRFYLIYRDAMDKRELKDTVPFPKYVSDIEKRYGPKQAGMVYCSGFLPDTEKYPQLAATRCPAGTTKLGILPDGAVYPCNLLFGRKEFLLGNILRDPWDSIWNHKALTFFRTYANNPCPQSSCEHHAACHGGCPAHGLLLSSDIAASDPRCMKMAAVQP